MLLFLYFTRCPDAHDLLDHRVVNVGVVATRHLATLSETMFYVSLLPFCQLTLARSLKVKGRVEAALEGVVLKPTSYHFPGFCY